MATDSGRSLYCVWPRRDVGEVLSRPGRIKLGEPLQTPKERNTGQKFLNSSRETGLCLLGTSRYLTFCVHSCYAVEPYQPFQISL